MKRGFVCLLAALVLVPFLALAVSAAIDPSPYLNDSGYKVTLGGFQRTFEEHLRPGADHSYVTNIKIEKYDEEKQDFVDFQKQRIEIHVPELNKVFFNGTATEWTKSINADGAVTKDEKKVNDRENSWTYDLRTGRQVYVKGSFTGSYYNAANFEFTIKNVRYQVYNLQSEYPTIEAYADSVHWQHGENDTYRRSVEKKGNATVVTLYNGGAEDDWEGTTDFGYYDYFVTNDAGIVQRRESANLPYHQVHRYLNRGQAWWFYPVSGLPSYYFVIMYDFSYLYSTEVPEDADKILPELKSFEEDYAKAKKAWDEAMAELEAVTIHTTGGPIVTPEGEVEDPNADSKKTDVTVDTPAGTEAGEDAGTTIPAIIILGTLGAAAALAGAAGGESGEDDKKKRSQFWMYVSKNFGASLKKGAPPQEVYARIAEITPEGREIPRPDLTEEIRVYSSDDSLIVKDGGTVNGRRRALASVYDEAEPKPEGRVSFYFEGEGGSFTENVIFNIEVPGIKFFQENLTLPAGELEEPEFLPFEVSGMGEKYSIDLSYLGEHYEIGLTDCDDPERTEIHYAVFMEKDKETYEAGVYTEGVLNVTVKNDVQELKGSIKIIRMGMGLCVPIKAVNCYRVPKKTSAGKEMKDMTPADFETAVTDAPAFLLRYDAENHRVCQSAAFPTFTFAPLESETEEKKKQIADALAQVKITPKLTKVEEDVCRYALVCEGGFLDAPARYVVRMTCEAEAPAGETADGKNAGTERYVFVRDVLLRSQPSRVVAGVRENHEVYKYDDQISEMLFSIKKTVFEHYLNQLFPLYNMIDRMVMGYDKAYGYDPYQVAKVVDVWERFQSGALKGIGSEVNQYGVADELEALAAATRSWDGWQGIVLRLSLDIMTGGASEVVMVALDMNRAAMDYRKETGGRGSVFGYFKAAAIPLVFAVGFGAAAAFGRGAAGAAGKAVKKLMPKKGPALLQKIQTVKNTAKEMAALAAQDAKNAVGYAVSKIPQGAKNASAKIGEMLNAVVEKVDRFDPRISVPKAKNATSVVSANVSKGNAAGDAVIEQARTAPKTIKEKCIDAAGQATGKEGEILYNEMIAAKKALQANPTSGAAQIRYNQAMMEFKASHAAIEHANAVLPGEQLPMRAMINEDIEKTFASRVEEKFREKIANKYNIDPATVRFDRATANKNAAVKFGRDIDWTPKVVTEKGGTKYVSQATADEFLEQSVRETIEETCGKDYAKKFAENGKFARKLDQTACTVQNKDYFAGGLDTVEQVTKVGRMGEYMEPEKARSVADTLRYKGAHPYAEGAKLEKEILSGLSEKETGALIKELEAFASADAKTAKTITLSENAKKLKEAYALMEEGMYQPAKYGKNLTEKEWVALQNGYSETLTGQDFVNARILDRGSGQTMKSGVLAPGTAQTGERITLSEARKACELNGSTLDAAIGGVGDGFEKINAKLRFGSGSQIKNAVNVGGRLGNAINKLDARSDG